MCCTLDFHLVSRHLEEKGPVKDFPICPMCIE